MVTLLSNLIKVKIKMANSNNFVTIENGISDFTGGKVTIKKSFNYLGLLWFVIGIILLVTQSFGKDNSTLTMILLVAGIALVIYGAISFFLKKTGYYYGTRPMKLRTFLFNAERSEEVIRQYNAGEFSNLLDIPRDSAAKIMIKILVDNDYLVAYSQILKFSSQNYDYEPSSEIRIHDPEQCQKINTLVISY